MTFTATAVDPAGAPVAVTCTPPSGTGFRIGTSNVVCTAGAPGASSSSSFTVTVTDTLPPTIQCNPDIATDATSAAGALVTCIASAFDPCGIQSLDCQPAPGSTFPIGETIVTCRAVDPAGNASSCSFEITVRSDNRPPTAQIDTDALVDFSPDFEHPVLISCNWWNACLILDGSLSSDPD